ncbi:hypothetical protein BX070DRAFT_250931 [Coemansia spiralis]|nr:hypothetical protein BX070DRAFT_250931 [Coemansia spiralis]
MASYMLSRSRVLVSQTRPSSQYSRSFGASERTLQTTAVHSMSLFSNIKGLILGISEQAMTKDPLTAAASSNKPSIVQKLSAAGRRGGYDLGAGMHLQIPIKANNVEKAWELWAVNLRQGDDSLQAMASKKDLVGLLLLLLKSSELRSTDMFADGSADKKNDGSKAYSIAGFRISVLLRHMLSRAIVEQHKTKVLDATDKAQESTASSLLEMTDLQLKLNQKVYEQLVSILACSIDSTMPTGNTYTPNGMTAEELAVYMDNAPLIRIIYAIICAAIRDGSHISLPMLSAALEAAIAMQDTTAVRDIIQLCYSDIARLLDPRLPDSDSGPGANIMEDPSSKECRTAIELVLKAISVGRDPQFVELSVDTDRMKQDASYEPLTDISGYATNKKSAADVKATHSWRVQTAERVYRAFVSAGISEVSSPDHSSQTAIQGSVVPSSLIIAHLIDIYCKAGNVEQAIILYDTLVAHLPQLSTQGSTDRLSDWNVYEDNDKNLNQGRGLGMYVWMGIFDAVCATGQLWLAARVLSDVVGDGRVPTSKMFQRYLRLISEPSRESLVDAMNIIKNDVVGRDIRASNRSLRQNLIYALARTGLQLPEDYMDERIEQALALSGLPVTAEGAAASEIDLKTAVSLRAARRIISALMHNGKIPRAQYLAELWCTAWPELVDSKRISGMISALADSEEYEKALRLFVDYQNIADNEITVGILSAVLKVYVHAGDFAEAVSVSKRLRAMVSDMYSRSGGKDNSIIPHRTVYDYMIKACCEENMAAEALRVVEEMRNYKVNASSSTYTTLINLMSNLRSYEGLKLITALAHVDYNMECNFDNREYQGTRWLPSRPLPLTTDYYNALVEAYGRVAEPTKALQAWEMMRIQGIKPNHLTATLLFDICGWNERVHWDEDMDPQAKFHEREVPKDHVYTGIPFFHMHYLAAILRQLNEAGLELSIANYRHLIETLARYGFLEDIMAMLIGRYEDPKEKAMFEEVANEFLKKNDFSVFVELAKMFRKIRGIEEEKPRESVARFMDFSIDIPLCQETVDTVYGTIVAMRAKCVSEEGVDPTDLPLVQCASPNLFKRLSLHEQRLDRFLRKNHPNLLPKTKLETGLLKEDGDAATATQNQHFF